MTGQDSLADSPRDDLDRIVGAFKKHGVEFMVVGGVAVIYHGYVRTTKDLDLFIRRTEENAKRAVAAIKEASGEWPDLTADSFLSGKGVIVGESPMRFDVISELPGVRFEEALPRCARDYYGDELVPYIHLDDLIKNKRAVARPQDLNDAAQLEAIREQLRDQQRRQKNR